MRLLRYLHVLALVLWLGGLVVAGAIVAPSVFGVLEKVDAMEDRVLGGQVFGEVLRRLHLLAYAMAGVMIVALTVHRLLGSRPVAYGIRVTIVGLMLALTVASGLGVSPRVESLQHQVEGPISALPADDARRVEFNRLHGVSSLLLSITAAGGLVLLFWEARE